MNHGSREWWGSLWPWTQCCLVPDCPPATLTSLRETEQRRWVWMHSWGTRSVGSNSVPQATEEGREGKPVFTGKSTTIVYPTPKGQLWKHRQVTLHRLRRLYLGIYMYVHIHIHTHITSVNEKGGHELVLGNQRERNWARDQWVHLSRREERKGWADWKEVQENTQWLLRLERSCTESRSKGNGPVSTTHPQGLNSIFIVSSARPQTGSGNKRAADLTQWEVTHLHTYLSSVTFWIGNATVTPWEPYMVGVQQRSDDQTSNLIQFQLHFP